MSQFVSAYPRKGSKVERTRASVRDELEELWEQNRAYEDRIKALEQQQERTARIVTALTEFHKEPK